MLASNRRTERERSGIAMRSWTVRAIVTSSFGCLLAIACSAPAVPPSIEFTTIPKADAGNPELAIAASWSALGRSRPLGDRDRESVGRHDHGVGHPWDALGEVVDQPAEVAGFAAELGHGGPDPAASVATAEPLRRSSASWPGFRSPTRRPGCGHVGRGEHTADHLGTTGSVPGRISRLSGRRPCPMKQAGTAHETTVDRPLLWSAWSDGPGRPRCDGRIGLGLEFGHG